MRCTSLKVTPVELTSPQAISRTASDPEKATKLSEAIQFIENTFQLKVFRPKCRVIIPVNLASKPFFIISLYTEVESDHLLS